jgi:glycine cleavage system H protein
MLVPNDLRYSRDHQWVRVEGDLLRVGITEFAQEALGEVTMVQLADVQTAVAAGDEMGEIEAFKAMTDLYMPVDAVVVEPNAALAVTPTAVNSDPYGQGWLCTVRPSSAADVNSLLDAQAYLELIGYTNG